MEYDLDWGYCVQARLLVIGGTVRGIEYVHPRPDNRRPCEGYVPLSAGPGDDHWTATGLEDPDTLTIYPSLLCPKCGHHGFVYDGSWVPA